LANFEQRIPEIMGVSKYWYTVVFFELTTTFQNLPATKKKANTICKKNL
jgi:hypothetical protein